MGEDEVTLTKEALGLSSEAFHVPEEVSNLFAQRAAAMEAVEAEWNELFSRWSSDYPDRFNEWKQAMGQELPDLEALFLLEAGESLATRASSGKTIQALADAVPYLVGGSADLAPSNNTYMKAYSDIGKDHFEGRNFHFGVRELGMAAIMNGIQLHGGLRVFGGTFLVFADFLRPAARLAALMGIPVIYVFTHDSFCVGEDGPTHQPIETAASLRMIHNLTVIRPVMRMK